MFVTGADQIAVTGFRRTGRTLDIEARVGITTAGVQQALRRDQPTGAGGGVDGAAGFQIEGRKAVAAGAAAGAATAAPASRANAIRENDLVMLLFLLLVLAPAMGEAGVRTL